MSSPSKSMEQALSTRSSPSPERGSEKRRQPIDEAKDKLGAKSAANDTMAKSRRVEGAKVSQRLAELSDSDAASALSRALPGQTVDDSMDQGIEQTSEAITTSSTSRDSASLTPPAELSVDPPPPLAPLADLTQAGVSSAAFVPLAAPALALAPTSTAPLVARWPTSLDSLAAIPEITLPSSPEELSCRTTLPTPTLPARGAACEAADEPSGAAPAGCQWRPSSAASSTDNLSMASAGGIGSRMSSQTVSPHVSMGGSQTVSPRRSSRSAVEDDKDDDNLSTVSSVGSLDRGMKRSLHLLQSPSDTQSPVSAKLDLIKRPGSEAQAFGWNSRSGIPMRGSSSSVRRRSGPSSSASGGRNFSPLAPTPAGRSFVESPGSGHRTVGRSGKSPLGKSIHMHSDVGGASGSTDESKPEDGE